LAPLRLPAGFSQRDRDGLTIIYRDVEGAWIEPLLAECPVGFRSYASTPFAAGRGGTRLVENEAQQVVVRQGLRGGLPGRFLINLYFGFAPRVVQEIEVTEHLRQCGVAVAPAIGAAVQWLVPGCYRSWLATDYIAGSETLGSWLGSHVGSENRRDVLRALGAAVRGMHDAGVVHPDLNLDNAMIDANAEPTVTLIDFDGARRVSTPPAIEPVLRRLQRSANRLGTMISASDLEAVKTGHDGK